jgi:hypothetical protein
MKVLSIQQPWAELICMGIKDVENRSWNTNFRGEFLIHASEKFDFDALEIIQEEYNLLDELVRSDFRTGGIIGKANLVDCVKDYKSDWSMQNQFQFVLEDADFIDFIACKGALKFWNFNKDLN